VTDLEAAEGCQVRLSRADEPDLAPNKKATLVRIAREALQNAANTLILHPRRAFSRETILSRVWDYNYLVIRKVLGRPQKWLVAQHLPEPTDFLN
jgi:hypothetical protein